MSISMKMVIYTLIFLGVLICFNESVIGQESVIFPGEEWLVDLPENHGLKTKALDEAGDKIRWTMIRYCFVVIKDGYVVYERYYFGDRDSKHRAYSVTKLLGTTVVGVAETKGIINLNSPIASYLKPPGSIHPKATIQHVLSQVSESDPPGTKFKYNSKEVINSLSHAVSQAARKADLSDNSEAFAARYVLKPLGLTKQIEWTGENLDFGKGSCGTCRAYARVGWLFLNKGRWKDHQLIDENYIEEATHPQFPNSNTGYGYLIWLNNDQGHWVRPFSNGSGKMISNAPVSLYMATGFLGQLIYVLPESNIVVVSMGHTPRLETLKTARKIWDAFAPAILETH